jgi:hypothetical protein
MNLRFSVPVDARSATAAAESGRSGAVAAAYATARRTLTARSTRARPGTKGKGAAITLLFPPPPFGERDAMKGFYLRALMELYTATARAERENDDERTDVA